MSMYSSILGNLLKVGALLNKPSSERTASSINELRVKIAAQVEESAGRSDSDRGQDFLHFVQYPVHNLLICLFAGVDIYNDLQGRAFDQLKVLGDAKLAKFLLKRKITAPDGKEVCAADFLFIGTDFTSLSEDDKMVALKAFFKKSRRSITTLSYLYANLNEKGLKMVNGMPVSEAIPSLLLDMITGSEHSEDQLADDYYALLQEGTYEISRGEFRKKRRKTAFSRYLTKAKTIYNKAVASQRTTTIPMRNRATLVLQQISYIPHRISDLVANLVKQSRGARSGVDTDAINYENVLTEENAISNFTLSEEITFTEQREDQKREYSARIADVDFATLDQEGKEEYIHTAVQLINYRDMSATALQNIRDNLPMVSNNESVQKTILQMVLDRQFQKGSLSPADEAMVGISAYSEKEIEAGVKSLETQARARLTSGLSKDKTNAFFGLIQPLVLQLLSSRNPNLRMTKDAKQISAYFLRNYEGLDRLELYSNHFFDKSVEEIVTLMEEVRDANPSDHPLAHRPISQYSKKRNLDIKGASSAGYALLQKLSSDTKVLEALEGISTDRTKPKYKEEIKKQIAQKLHTSEYVSSTLMAYAKKQAIRPSDYGRNEYNVPSHRVYKSRAQRFLSKDKKSLLGQIKLAFVKASSAAPGQSVEEAIESKKYSYDDFKSVFEAEYGSAISGDFKEQLEERVAKVLSDEQLDYTTRAKKLRDAYFDTSVLQSANTPEVKNYEANYRAFTEYADQLQIEHPIPRGVSLLTDGITDEQRTTLFLSSFLTSLSSYKLDQASRVIPLLGSGSVSGGGSIQDLAKSLLKGAASRALDDFETRLRRTQKAELEELIKAQNTARDVEIEETQRKLGAEGLSEDDREALTNTLVTLESQTDDEYSLKIRAKKRQQKDELKSEIRRRTENGEITVFATYNKTLEGRESAVEEEVLNALTEVALAQSANQDAPEIRSLNRALTLRARMGEDSFSKVLKDTGLISNLTSAKVSALRDLVLEYTSFFKAGKDRLIQVLNFAHTSHTGAVNAADSSACYKSPSILERPASLPDVLRFFHSNFTAKNAVSNLTNYPISTEDTDSDSRWDTFFSLYFIRKDASKIKDFLQGSGANGANFDSLQKEMKSSLISFLSDLSYYVALATTYSTSPGSDIPQFDIDFGEKLLVLFNDGAQGDVKMLRSKVREVVAKGSAVRGKRYLENLSEEYTEKLEGEDAKTLKKNVEILTSSDMGRVKRLLNAFNEPSYPYSDEFATLLRDKDYGEAVEKLKAEDLFSEFASKINEFALRRGVQASGSQSFVDAIVRHIEQAEENEDSGVLEDMAAYVMDNHAYICAQLGLTPSEGDELDLVDLLFGVNGEKVPTYFSGTSFLEIVESRDDFVLSLVGAEMADRE